MIKLSYSENGKPVNITVEASSAQLENHLLDLIADVIAQDSMKRQMTGDIL